MRNEYDCFQRAFRYVNPTSILALTLKEPNRGILRFNQEKIPIHEKKENVPVCSFQLLW